MTIDPIRPEPGALVKVKIGEHEYDAKYVKSCHTCTHPARVAIEEMLLGSVSYQSISNLYSEVEIEVDGGAVITTPKLGWQSVRAHYKNGHMPLQVAALRRMADKRAEELSEEYEGVLDRYVDRYDVAKTILQLGYDRIVSGNAEVEVKDTLAAAKFLHDADQGSQVDAEAWSQAMQVYFETAQRVMPPELWQTFVTELSVNPVLRALEKKAAEGQDGIVDAEIVNP